MSETQRSQQGSDGASADQVRNAERADSMIEKPSSYVLGSLESRIAARTMLERTRTEQRETIILVRIEHIGHDAKEPLPPSQIIPGKSGATEIIHVAGGSS
jgi:hypothetical protein